MLTQFCHTLLQRKQNTLFLSRSNTGMFAQPCHIPIQSTQNPSLIRSNTGMLTQPCHTPVQSMQNTSLIRSNTGLLTQPCHTPSLNRL